MRTNIKLDDELIAEAMELTDLPSKRATVEKALRDLVEHYRRKNALEALRGIGWEGDLDEMRSGWEPREDWALEEPK
ncbi:type II toxin-antitoxin system VapB family antitoxin [Agrobacterium rosae]|nr:type II toxin-antitoxin system VapB family antitoxin [Agrobacterium rosae]MBN7804673.1 type II toxin-antitoxin system VapB family antitoxin [Agrobacterium rosae]